jgi:polyisoprenoid-binding protein YceI
MKHIAFTSLALIALATAPASAQLLAVSSDAAPVRLAVRSDSKLWLEGSSNVRDWRCNATTLDASVDLDDAGSRASEPAGITHLRHVQVRVPTRGLTCGRSQMDNIMYKALHADDEPDCRDIVGRFDVVSRSGRDHELVMQGTLRVAGQERWVRLPIEVERLHDGTLRARGALPILMTDYGITPPTVFFGVLRTENRIVVKFDLLIEQPTTLASSAAGGR